MEFTHFSNLDFTRAITGNRKFVNPYETQAYTDFNHATAVEIDLQKAGLVVIDIDIKESHTFERDYVFDILQDNIDLSNAFIEYSKNKGIHIYFKATAPQSKIVYKTATDKLIEILNHKVACTNDPHEHSEYQDFIEFYNNAGETDFDKAIAELNKLYKLETFTGEHDEIVADKSDKVKYYSNFIIKHFGVYKFIEYLGIDNKEYSNYYSFFSLLQPDGNKHGAIVYKKNGVVVDFHTGQKYNFLTYFRNHPIFINRKIEEVVEDMCKKNSVVFVPFFNKTNIVVDNKYNKIRLDSKYIPTSTIESILDKAANMNKRIIQIKANTGTGKTTAMLDIAIKKNKATFLFVFPYRAQVEQLEKNYSNNSDFCFLYEGKQYLSNKRVYISTYDSIQKIYYFDNFDYFIIDEYHNIILQKAFRHAAINNIISVVKDYSKTLITLTATPEIVYFSKEDVYSVEIIPQQPKNYQEITKVVITADNSKIKHNDIKINFILNNHKSGNIDVVFCHSRMLIWQMKRIIEAAGYTVTTICSKEQKLGTDASSEEEYNYIIHNNAFSGKYEFILTTIVLSDGINITNDNIDKCYIYSTNPHHFSITTIKQSIARFRAGVNSIYLFNNKKADAVTGFNALKLYNKTYDDVVRTKTEMDNKIIKTLELAPDICTVLLEESKLRTVIKVFHPLRYIDVSHFRGEYTTEINNELIKQDIFELYANYAATNLTWFFDDMQIIYLDGTDNIPTGINDNMKEAKKIAKEEIKSFIRNSPVSLHVLAKMEIIKNAKYKYNNYILPEEQDINITELEEYVSDPASAQLIKKYTNRYIMLIKQITIETFKEKEQFFISHIFAPNNRWQEFITNLRLSKMYAYFNATQDIKDKYDALGDDLKTNFYTTYNELKKAINIIRENEKKRELNKSDLVKKLMTETILTKQTLESITASKTIKTKGANTQLGVLNLNVDLIDINTVRDDLEYELISFNREKEFWNRGIV